MGATKAIIIGAAAVAIVATVAVSALAADTAQFHPPAGKGVYKTPRASTVVHSSGWGALPSGRIITRLPLIDAATNLFARNDYRTLLEVAEREGARIISPAAIAELHAAGLELKPCFLPTGAMVAKMPPRGPNETEIAYQTRIRLDMGTAEWAEIHDRCVWEQLNKRWGGESLVANAGKHWAFGAPKGRSYLMGWWLNGKFVQPHPMAGSQGPHDDRHADYGTTSMLEKVAA